MYSKLTERRGWYSGRTFDTHHYPTLEAAMASTGYGSQVFVRLADGSHYADLSDYRFGESAYVYKVLIQEVGDGHS